MDIKVGSVCEKVQGGSEGEMGAAGKLNAAGCAVGGMKA
jgi:hypothetical protein